MPTNLPSASGFLRSGLLVSCSESIGWASLHLLTSDGTHNTTTSNFCANSRQTRLCDFKQPHKQPPPLLHTPLYCPHSELAGDQWSTSSSARNGLSNPFLVLCILTPKTLILTVPLILCKELEKKNTTYFLFHSISFRDIYIYEEGFIYVNINHPINTRKSINNYIKIFRNRFYIILTVTM